MAVEQRCEDGNVAGILTTLLSECSAVTDYRTLRDSLPRRLAVLLQCRCVLLYQHVDETLQFVAGTFDEKPGWSSALLAVAHINPIDVSGESPEACAWRERHAIVVPAVMPTLIAVPLLYRQRSIGVMVGIRGGEGEKTYIRESWTGEELPMLDAVAGVVALLLENARLLERDRERIHELFLLNSISSQLNCTLYETERLQQIVIQRAREITAADLCELLEPAASSEAIAWITPTLREMLLRYFHEQKDLRPFIIERPGDSSNPHALDYLNQLPADIKTFFAVPLLNGRAMGRRSDSLQKRKMGIAPESAPEAKVLGVVVGAYYRACKLRRAEVVLLQVLASQASTVIENMDLVVEVVEARNEARKLLRRVQEDQHAKEIILESIPSGLITVDVKGRITTFNRAAEAMLGHRAYEMLGQSLRSVLDLEALLGQHERSDSLANGADLMSQSAYIRTIGYMRHVQRGTIITLDRQGQEVVLDITLLPLHDEQGEQIGMLATFTDVTSVHRLEEETRRLDRLASLGEMAANVAHEVRNPLAAIKASMQMLMDDLVEEQIPVLASATLRTGADRGGQDHYGHLKDDWAQESVAVVLKEVERLDTIVRDLLLFARPRQLHPVTCDMVALSERVLQLLHRQCAEANIVVHRVYSDVPSLWADEAQMEQILFNLYINALQAMKEGGILTISCHSIHANSIEYASGKDAIPPFQQRNRREAAQQWVELLISDTGIGIPLDQLERIFQPFFTTKAHGIGLGLPITRRLVEDHGGHIRVESHFGYGTTVMVRLPIMLCDGMCTRGDE